MNESVRSSTMPLAQDIRRFRRIVTGVNGRGQSVILSDGLSPHVMPFMGIPNFAVTDFWKASTPAENGEATSNDPCGVPIKIVPPAGGSVFRVTQFPPEKEWMQPAAGARHPHMHRTRTLDYAIVLFGEIWVVMDEGETKLVAGDVLIQRGTNHAWANRSESPCIVAFIMLDALAE
jgi:quercetin dioxygenase-like cupin family protein